LNLSPNYPLDSVSRSSIDEKHDESHQQGGNQEFDEEPLETGTDNVADGLPRAQEPDKRGVRTTVSGRWVKGMVGERDKQRGTTTDIVKHKGMETSNQ
jgi:hypothetical protein